MYVFMSFVANRSHVYKTKNVSRTGEISRSGEFSRSGDLTGPDNDPMSMIYFLGHKCVTENRIVKAFKKLVQKHAGTVDVDAKNAVSAFKVRYLFFQQLGTVSGSDHTSEGHRHD